jgi:hypothetical protein
VVAVLGVGLAAAFIGVLIVGSRRRPTGTGS